MLATNSRMSAPTMNTPGLPERMTRPARSLRPSSVVEMLVELVEHGARQDVGAAARIVEREHRDVLVLGAEFHVACVGHSSITFRLASTGNRLTRGPAT